MLLKVYVLFLLYRIQANDSKELNEIKTILPWVFTIITKLLTLGGFDFFKTKIVRNFIMPTYKNSINKKKQKPRTEKQTKLLGSLVGYNTGLFFINFNN